MIESEIAGVQGKMHDIDAGGFKNKGDLVEYARLNNQLFRDNAELAEARRLFRSNTPFAEWTRKDWDEAHSDAAMALAGKGAALAKADTTIAAQALQFARTPAAHMENPGRHVPLQLLSDVINTARGYPDPRGSSAMMYYSPMIRDGKAYNLEVLYNPASHMILHFEYARKAMGPLPAVGK